VVKTTEVHPLLLHRAAGRSRNAAGRRRVALSQTSNDRHVATPSCFWKFRTAA